MNILGHPEGKDMVVSLQDNKVLKVVDSKLRYRTPTLRGSSGSPVFNQQWELVALHHGSVAKANEGILIGAILKAIRRKLNFG